ncbi:DUF4214 domain-containing protein [Massilia sp. SR12]
MLNFSEAVVAGKGFINFVGQYGVKSFSLSVTDPRVSISGKTVTIDPPADLPFGARLQVSYPDGWLLDASGNSVRYGYLDLQTGFSPVALNWVGTDGNDSMLGSDFADTLNGAGGADILHGNGGDDILYGGDELVYPGDELNGGSGNDKLYGGIGEDKLRGDEGNDLLEGGDGNDTLSDGVGDDRLLGGAGHDRLSDWQGSNVLDGGDGNDDITSSTNQASTVSGGAGDDTITLGGGKHIVSGGAGDDKFEFVADSYSQAGLVAIAQIDGGEGKDTFKLGAAGLFELRLTGGAGIDKFVMQNKFNPNKYVVTDFQAGAGGDVLDIFNFLIHDWAGPSNPFAPGGYLRLAQEGADTVLYWDVDGNGVKPAVKVVTLENLRATSLTSANFTNGLAPNGSSVTAPVYGTNGDDDIDGDWLDNTIYGGAGNDTLSGSRGNDSLYGGAGNDKLYSGSGVDCASLLDGGEGNDELYAGSDHNTLRGGAGNDYLQARSSGINVLEGGSGDDELEAGWGEDSLMDGGDGNDVLEIHTYHQLPQRTVKAFGGNGNDIFKIHGYLADTTKIEVSGGAGADLFDLHGFGAPAETVIHDFNVAEGDRLKLASSLSNMSAGNGNPFASGLLRVAQNGSDTQILVYYQGSEMVGVTLKNTLASSLTAQAFVEGYAVVGVNDVAKNLVGTTSNDTLSGGQLDDVLSGLGGYDSLYGYGGNDRLLGGSGNDHLNGGTGIDTAVMDMARADARIKIDASGKVQVDAPYLNYEIDTLLNVERIQFKDAHIAVDVNGVGGQVYRLYQAAFDRKPDLQGVGYWMAAAEKGIGLMDIAAGFINSDEFRKLYGTNPGNGELIDRFYQNVLHRAPDADGRAYWLDVLDRKLVPLNVVLVGFSESAENAAAVAKVIGAGFEYTPWMG